MFHVLAGRKQQRVGGQGGGVLLPNKQQLKENISGHQGLGDEGPGAAGCHWGLLGQARERGRGRGEISTA